MTLKSTIFFAFNCIALFISANCFGQTKPKPSPISLERIIEIEGQQNRKTENIDLGEIEIAQPYALTLRLKNTGKETFRFGKIEGNCSCMNIRVNEGEIKSGKHIDIVVDFTAPKRNPVNFLIALRFFETEKTPTSMYDIQAKAKLRGVLRFGIYNRLIELEQKKISTIRVPFEVSDPLKVENLEVKVSETLKDFAPQSVVFEGNPFVSLEIPDAGIPEDYLSGWVEVKDNSSGRSDKAELLFSKFKPFRISPEIARLTEPKENSKEVKTKASGFMRLGLPKNLDGKAGDTNVGTKVSATATINKSPIEVNLKKISSSIYQWRLEIDYKVLEDAEEGGIDWNIQIDGQSFMYKTLWSKSK